MANNCPPFMMYNKKHLSKKCAAGRVTNGAGVIPGMGVMYSSTGLSTSMKLASQFLFLP